LGKCGFDGDSKQIIIFRVKMNSNTLTAKAIRSMEDKASKIGSSYTKNNGLLFKSNHVALM